MTLLAGLFLAATVGVAFTAYLGLLSWNLAVPLIAALVVLFYLATTLHWARDISIRVDAADQKLRRLELMYDSPERLDALEDRLYRLEGGEARGELAGRDEPTRLDAADDGTKHQQTGDEESKTAGGRGSET